MIYFNQLADYVKVFGQKSK